MRGRPRQKDDCVFINCPFDKDYPPVLAAVIFCVKDCGFVVRCALERNDSGHLRMAHILSLIGVCKYGIHDLSRVELDARARLPRFNMPLELGLYLGAREYGPKAYAGKRTLILDSERYRYQAACSDLSGADISAHGDDPDTAIKRVRDWLNPGLSESVRFPRSNPIIRRYARFRSDLQLICETSSATLDEVYENYLDLCNAMDAWLRGNLE